MGYGSGWPEISKRFLRHHPVCEDCGGPSTQTDHQPPRKDLVERGIRYPDADHWLHARCHACHARKTFAQAPGATKKRRWGPAK